MNSPRTISSAMTVFMKIIFPAIWITGFGAGTLALWLCAPGVGRQAPPPEMKYFFSAIWIAGSGLVLFFSTPLKRVRVDNANLYISSYSREITVPLRQVRAVTENVWINTHPVTIHFHDSTEFGSKITFMPRHRFPGFLRSHPIAQELRRLAGIE